MRVKAIKWNDYCLKRKKSMTIPFLNFEFEFYLLPISEVKA